MKTITKSELQEILHKHKLWLEGKRRPMGEKANLSFMDLSGVDLQNVNLKLADLCGTILVNTNLRNANLEKAMLCGVDLTKADLSGATLSFSTLCNANLSDANLQKALLNRANLSHATLIDTNLHSAILIDANLRDSWVNYSYLMHTDLRLADLSNANFSHTDLTGAILDGIILNGADLRDVKNVPYIPMVCPEEGSFIGWKKAKYDKIVKLFIPTDAKRSSATERKCRCNKAKVLAIENIDGTPSKLQEIESGYDSNFIYKVGEMVEVPNFWENRWKMCAEGIHFFINRQEAVEYRP